MLTKDVKNNQHLFYMVVTLGLLCCGKHMH